MFIKRECSRQSLLSWISMTLEPANCGAARCRAAPPRLRRRAAPIAFLQGPQNDRVQTGLNSEGVTFPIPGLLLLSPALHQRANLATRQTTQFTKSTDCGSIAWFVTFTKVARGQSNVALRTLQPGMNTGALAGGVASVRVVRLRIWSMVCATYAARTMYSPVLCDWRSPWSARRTRPGRCTPRCSATGGVRTPGRRPEHSSPPGIPAESSREGTGQRVQ